MRSTSRVLISTKLPLVRRIPSNTLLISSSREDLPFLLLC